MKKQINKQTNKVSINIHVFNFFACQSFSSVQAKLISQKGLQKSMSISFKKQFMKSFK